MSSVALSLILFACVFGGALVGILLHAVLPQHHLGSETKDIVKLGMGLVGTMSALTRAIDQMRSKDGIDNATPTAPPACGEILLDQIKGLAPTNDTQRSLQSQATSMTIDLEKPAG